MADGFQYGRCAPWRATVSTDFCRTYKASGNYKCQTCGGLIMNSITETQTIASGTKPAEQRPAFQDRLRNLMTAKSADLKIVSAAVALSTHTVRNWLTGEYFPTVAQAGRLDELFGSTLTEEYKDLLRKGNAAPLAKTKTAAPAPEKKPAPSGPLADILATAATLEKKSLPRLRQLLPAA